MGHLGRCSTEVERPPREKGGSRTNGSGAHKKRPTRLPNKIFDPKNKRSTMTITLQHETLLQVFDSQQQQVPSVAKQQHDFVMINKEDWCQLRRCASDDADTLSTASLSDSSSISDYCERRVSFAEELISDVWTRPYTPPEDVEDLYYSVEAISSFRSEYRLERKLASDCDDKDVDDSQCSTACSTAPFRITRVVVLHENKLQTLTSDRSDGEDFDNASFWQGSITWY